MSLFSFIYQLIGLTVRVFANGLGNRGPKTKKMVLVASLLNTQHYKEHIKGKWSYPGKELHSPQHLGVVTIEKGAFGLLLNTINQLTYKNHYALPDLGIEPTISRICFIH